MFFTQDLLARRDSGFGLLWLAATLGSKSTFKKLSKKSVLTADISQLCDLIAEPPEPLALRLSSNLMIGVARVYKVKQEILSVDVANCATSLKRVVQDVQSLAATAQLQMAQPTVRPSALTLSSKTSGTHVMDFDALVADWDEYLNIAECAPTRHKENDDKEFDPSQAIARQGKNGQEKARPSSTAEHLRADAVTLKEHHDHLLSGSFDLSFNGSGGGLDPSSSQAEVDFIIGDTLLPLRDGLNLRVDDELALGEGWGGTPAQSFQPENDIQDFDLPMDIDWGNDGVGAPSLLGDNAYREPSLIPSSDPADPLVKHTRKRKTLSGSGKENQLGSALSPGTGLSPAASFSRLLLSQDEEAFAAPLMDITAQKTNQLDQGPRPRSKRSRLLLDARTELTDEELKIARAQYVQAQSELRFEMNQKKTEKEREKLIDDIIWGVPGLIQAPDLMDFWQENFKVQVEARTGVLHIHVSEGRPTKRQKTWGPTDLADNSQPDETALSTGDMDNPGIGLGNVFGYDHGPAYLRSSEEPGQGRHQSRPPSFFGDNFSLDLPSQGQLDNSQKSSMFPWDNAGFPSSSSGPLQPQGSDRISIDRAEVAMKGSIFGRRSRESSLVPSQVGSGLGYSPNAFASRGNSQVIGEDYAFEVNEDANQSNQVEAQQSEITLERNSSNFLEYVKMQQQAIAHSDEGLPFYTVVPKVTSTRHVAAAAFYHCLVLATKNYLLVNQTEPYGPLTLAIHV